MYSDVIRKRNNERKKMEHDKEKKLKERVRLKDRDLG